MTARHRDPARVRPPDQAHRSRATTLFDRNLVVTAGAGTGKTAILVERALNLIGSGEAALENLALITFTEKAAAELRLRLGRGLERLLRRSTPGAEPDDGTEDGDRAWRWLSERGTPAAGIRRAALAALHDLDGAAIGTIHAFCSDILRRYPREARVDPLFAADDGVAFARVFEEAWADRLSSDLGPTSARADVWRGALGAGDAPSLVREVARVLADATLPDEARAPLPPADPATLLSGAVGEALEGIRRVLARGRGFRPAYQDFLDTAGAALGAFVTGGIEGLRRAATPEAVDRAAHIDVDDPGRRVTGISADEAAAGCAPARELLGLLAGLDEPSVAAMHAAAFPAAAAAGERLLAQGFVSFDAMLRLARDLLARDRGVRRALSRRFRRLLVDEFQDTDPLQYEILFFLAGGETPPAGDPYRTVLEPGRLFIVGDPKQSIYRFRGADIAAYRRAVEHVKRCGGEELLLTASFRSPMALLGPVNRLFEGWLGPAGDWDGDYAPPYDRIESALPAGGAEGPRVVIASVGAPAGATADLRRAAEAAAIAAWIAAETGPSGTSGALRFKDIAILFRAMTHAGLHARALRAAGIPFVIEGGKDFHERPEVNDLLMLLRSVASPNDGPALLAVLRSALGAVPDAELARFARAGGRLARPDARPPDAASCPNLARALGWIGRLREEVGSLPADVVVEKALSATPLSMLHAAAHDGPQRLANLRKMATIARGHAARGLSLVEAIAFIEEAFEGRTPEGESPLADETHDAVRVLSIHKAKGLEYPVVFVPDIGREDSHGRGDAGAAAAWILHGARGRLALRLGPGRWNAAWALRALEARRHEEAEERRVFYVACTRARERLFLVNSHRERSAPWRDRLAALGYRIGEDGAFPAEGPLDGDGVEHRVLAPAPLAPRAVAPVDLGEVTRAALSGRDAGRALAAKATAPVRWPSGTRSEDRSAPEGTMAGTDAVRRRVPARAGAPPAAMVGRVAGIAVHAALESWDFKEGTALVSRAALEADRAAADESGPGPGRTALAAAAGRESAVILEGFLASPLPRRLASATLLGREVPLLWSGTEGEVWTGACDILFEEGGALVVGDWKTDAVRGDAGAAAALYRDQIARYVEALRGAFPGREVRGEVFFVRRGLAIPL